MDFDETISMAKRIASQEERDVEAMRTLFYLIPNIMYLKAYEEEFTAGRYVMVSREWERAYSIRRDSVIGKTDYDFLPRAESDRQRLDEQHTLEFQKTTTVVNAVGTRYSGWNPVRMQLIPIAVNGDRFNYIAGVTLSTHTVSLDA